MVPILAGRRHSLECIRGGHFLAVLAGHILSQNQCLERFSVLDLMGAASGRSSRPRASGCVVFRLCWQPSPAKAMIPGRLVARVYAATRSGAIAGALLAQSIPIRFMELSTRRNY